MTLCTHVFVIVTFLLNQWSLGFNFFWGEGRLGGVVQLYGGYQAFPFQTQITPTIFTDGA